jgi:hypothetical protein
MNGLFAARHPVVRPARAAGHPHIHFWDTGRFGPHSHQAGFAGRAATRVSPHQERRSSNPAAALRPFPLFAAGGGIRDVPPVPDPPERTLRQPCTASRKRGSGGQSGMRSAIGHGAPCGSAATELRGGSPKKPDHPCARRQALPSNPPTVPKAPHPGPPSGAASSNASRSLPNRTQSREGHRILRSCRHGPQIPPILRKEL